MTSYLSLLLYIITFLSGIVLDSPRYRNNKNLRSFFVVWLYIFLCFGYMTGADWRNYEQEFYDWNRLFTKDYGYVYTVNFLHHLIGDFWIIYDGFRCLYLFSVILLLKKLTRFWMSSLSFLMPMSLLTLTVDSPYRFMIAFTFLNFAVYYILKHKNVRAILLCAIGATFHASVLLIIPLLLFVNTEFFVKTKNWILVLIYIVIILFTASLDRITNLHTIIGLIFSDFGLNAYKTYEADAGVNVFTFGLILQSMVFITILVTRNLVSHHTPNGVLITNLAILSFFVQRLCIAIPTGHRFGWFFTLFVAAYFANLFHIRYYRECINTNVFTSAVVRNIRVLFIVFIVYYGSTMTKTIVNHFAYIPYSNSIPYIISGHKPFNERVYYNLNAYKQRTGKNYELNTDEY